MNNKDFEESIDLRKLKEKWVEKLKILGEKLGFVCVAEVPTNGGRVDLVWFHKFRSRIPYLDDRLPVVGFEIETSWRTRKHIKGDIFNLLELSPACGVIVFLSEGFKENLELRGNVEAAKRYVNGFKGICKILILTEKDIEKMFISLKD